MNVLNLGGGPFPKQNEDLRDKLEDRGTVREKPIEDLDQTAPLAKTAAEINLVGADSHFLGPERDRVEDLVAALEGLVDQCDVFVVPLALASVA